MIEATVYSAQSGEEIGRVAFRADAPLEKKGLVQGSVEVRAPDLMRAAHLQVFLEQPHSMRTRRDDGTLEEHTVPPGTPGHFVLRLQALPPIGYRVELTENRFGSRAGEPRTVRR